MHIKKKPNILTTYPIASSRVFAIEGVTLQFSNGEQRDYERLHTRGQGAVMIAAIDDEDRVLLIREYAVGLESYELGFPKGLVEKGEDKALATNREMMEEIGVGARKLTFMRRLAASPGYLSSAVDFYMAQDLYTKHAKGDEPEPLEIVPWPLSQLDDLLAEPDVRDARTVAGIYLLKQHVT